MVTNLSNDKEVSFAEKIIVTRLKEGRGQGAGKKYRPFINVHDFPSLGRIHRLPSATVGRIHHLLSDLEHHVFCLLDWYPEIIDIREQFPIPRDESRCIAEKLGVAHPSYNQIDQVMTTDFLVTVNSDGVVQQRAISVKYAKDLEKSRVIEKLELERRYWEERDVSYYIVTEHEIPKTLLDNIKWFRPFLTNQEYDLQTAHAHFLSLNDYFTRFPRKRISEITQLLDDHHNLEAGSHLAILRHLLAQRAFTFDLVNMSVKGLTGADLIPCPHWIAREYEYVTGE